MDINRQIAGELGVKLSQVEAAVKLLDEGATVPFIARYRKEVTGMLDDVQLRKLEERLQYFRNLEDKKAQVLSTIEAQGKLTAQLRRSIEGALTQVELEDLYRPYRPKRRTRASIAKERGLEGLAIIIRLQQTKKSIEEEAKRYVDPEKGVNSVKEAVAGASDILAELIAEEPLYRTWIRGKIEKSGTVLSEAKDENEKSVYENYYRFEQPVSSIAGYRILALNRGEKEKFLTVKIQAPEEEILKYLERKIIRADNPFTTPVLKAVIEDSYRRLIFPSVEREIRNALTLRAEDNAIDVFGKNLSQLLMQPPIAGHVVLGWDPGYRNGCKLAVIDETGKVLDTTVVYPTAPTNEKKIRDAKDKVISLIRKYHVTLISLGNGTASRESEQLIVEWLKELPEKVSYIITNEAGASVYSASELASEEFPNIDVGQRSAASIARRVQDPLAELVKIDPRSIGVGQYQHDMNQKKLGEKLGAVVEDCVNRVGVDLNTASAPLLTYISGINKTIAGNIVAYREQNGRFTGRRQLLKVAKLGPKAYEQCAGFLRIGDAKNPLDATGVHPESYAAAEAILNAAGLTAKELYGASARKTKTAAGAKNVDIPMPDAEKMKELEKKFGIGRVSIQGIIHELKSAGRDPREDMPAPILRSDVLEIKDLKEGMILKGTVRNIVDFGAFVDIGVHQDGLVHISQLADRRVNHPLEVVSVGDVVEVRIISVDAEKGRIGLSMRNI